MAGDGVTHSIRLGDGEAFTTLSTQDFMEAMDGEAIMEDTTLTADTDGVIITGLHITGRVSMEDLHLKTILTGQPIISEA